MRTNWNQILYHRRWSGCRLRRDGLNPIGQRPQTLNVLSKSTDAAIEQSGRGKRRRVIVLNESSEEEDILAEFRGDTTFLADDRLLVTNVAVP